ncbi:thiol-disulfide oxidoreductase DCC family protein [Candidatus Binatus sp.]|uniref:thiol-disulfide oxidoreductase DCC family protein n=1 Tax=Candidatus Binatus sp. TaxID=2811406 RepID=UPI003C316EB3
MSADDQVASVGKASAGKLAILYDGSCAMCRASLDGIRQFDNSGKMEPLDLHHEDVRAQFPELKLENLLEELHAVDENGRVYRGARAINEILRRQNGLKGYLAYLWYIPGYAWLADRQYKRIAASRYARDASGRMKGQGQAVEQ